MRFDERTTQMSKLPVKKNQLANTTTEKNSNTITNPAITTYDLTKAKKKKKTGNRTVLE